MGEVNNSLDFCPFCNTKFPKGPAYFCPKCDGKMILAEMFCVD